LAGGERGEDQEMTGRVALVDSAFGHEALQPGSSARQPPQAGENLYFLSNSASAKPEKGQHGKTDDNHANNPEDIVHS
jgi:hypothetical protein